MVWVLVQRQVFWLGMGVDVVGGDRNWEKGGLVGL